jgi:hypothetical protein
MLAHFLVLVSVSFSVLRLNLVLVIVPIVVRDTLIGLITYHLDIMIMLLLKLFDHMLD